MPSRQRPKRKPQDAYTVRRSLIGEPNAIWPGELSEWEIWAVGVITIQWAYLEHMLLISTVEMAQKAGLEVPVDATSISFKRRLATWRKTVAQTVKEEWRRERFLKLASRIAHVESDRHKLTHGLWEWYPQTPEHLHVLSFRPPHQFSDHFTLNRLLKIGDRIGAINHELTYPPRKGLRKISIEELNLPYVSRRLLLSVLDKKRSPKKKIPPFPGHSIVAEPTTG